MRVTLDMEQIWLVRKFYSVYLGGGILIWTNNKSLFSDGSMIGSYRLGSTFYQPSDRMLLTGGIMIT